MILVWIGNVAHVGQGIAKPEGGEGDGIGRRADRGRDEMDRAEAVQALKDALTQSDLFALGEFDNLAMDGQKSSNGMVCVEIMLGALVVEVFTKIGHQRNAEKSQHSEKEKRYPRIEDVKRRNRNAKKPARRLAHDAPNTRLKMVSTCLKWCSRSKLASSSFSE